jgi:molybdopterin-guanine dinucleotide biosynthesis protein A
MDAVVLAGGRISGLYARAAGTEIKALAPLRGSPLLRIVTDALRRTAGIERICVVGPEAVRDVIGAECIWEEETGSALDNVRAGIERLGRVPSGRGESPLLICGSDLPALDPPSLEDFLRRAPAEADICLPLVRRETFVAAFPGNLGIYMRLAEGAFTAGSLGLARPRAVLENMPLFRSLHHRRKTQIGMAQMLGTKVVWKLLCRRLSLSDIEARLSTVAGCRCRAVPDCRPELAFDIDNLLDLRYIEKWQGSGQ